MLPYKSSGLRNYRFIVQTCLFLSMMPNNTDKNYVTRVRHKTIISRSCHIFTCWRPNSVYVLTTYLHTKFQSFNIYRYDRVQKFCTYFARMPCCYSTTCRKCQLNKYWVFSSSGHKIPRSYIRWYYCLTVILLFFLDGRKLRTMTSDDLQ
jgi:hypothetical protein